jgi:hypothetical protein
MSAASLLVLSMLAHAHDVPNIADMTSTTVRVVQGDSVCAGVWLDVDTPIVATAYHCVTGTGRVRIYGTDGQMRWGRVVRRRARHDLALVVADDGPHARARLADRPLRQGERVYAVGHPLAASEPSGYLDGTLLWSVSDGMVSQLGTIAVQHTAPLAPGYSGGPLFDETGSLVGIHSRRLTAPGLSFSTSSEHVLTLANALDEAGGRTLGGTVSLRPGVGSYGGSSPATYGTLELEIDVRKRVWVRIVGGVSSRDTATVWPMWEGGAGLRQTVGHGANALSVEMGWSQRLLSSRFRVSDEQRLTQNAALGFTIGLRFRGLGWRANWTPAGSWAGFNVSVDWPGTLTVY